MPPRASNQADVSLYLLERGSHKQASWKRMLPAFLTWAYGTPQDSTAPAADGITGTVRRHQAFTSNHVEPRNVDVWLPPGYEADPDRRYPVLYMHDGQNLFDPKLAYAGIDWGVDEAMTRLIAEGKVRDAIVVGIWNTPKRLAEYMPNKAVTTPGIHFVDGFPDLKREEILSDHYLAFLVDELKPFIDGHYRTLPGRGDTAIMGSSLGGLISAYAASEYPQVFGAAGGVSTHWPAGEGMVIDWLAAHLPDPRTHRFYFDFGTRTLDATYEPYQRRMDAAMQRAGYVQNHNWFTRKYEGAEHSEKSWRERVDVPLMFLLGPK